MVRHPGAEPAQNHRPGAGGAVPRGCGGDCLLCAHALRPVPRVAPASATALARHVGEVRAAALVGERRYDPLHMVSVLPDAPRLRLHDSPRRALGGRRAQAGRGQDWPDHDGLPQCRDVLHLHRLHARLHRHVHHACAPCAVGPGGWPTSKPCSALHHSPDNILLRRLPRPGLCAAVERDRADGADSALQLGPGTADQRHSHRCLRANALCALHSGKDPGPAV
mmetsp:Transcript_14428/g.36967  ORF Transcript_14428/g.36967 Transcript_14428/m.36967 type:complete len:223 (+) Transcript_14428:448-1116(+)